jgi:dehydrogenase/reductase SDR family member 7B
MKKTIFQNKICWITGASSGIGASLALSLNESGAYLVLSARNEENLLGVKRNCPHPERIEILPFDMERIDSLPEIAQSAWKIFGGIDLVFLNAGIAVRDLIVNTRFDLIEKVMNVNFLGNARISKTLIPLMKQRGSGRFVVTSSLCGKFGIPKLAAYSASKHALHGFFEALRTEYERDGIEVTLITAGLIRTQITVHGFQGNGNHYGKMQESVGNGISPTRCAGAILDAVMRGKKEALIGGIEKYSVWIKRFFPGFFARMIGKHPFRNLRRFGLLKGSERAGPQMRRPWPLLAG